MSICPATMRTGCRAKEVTRNEAESSSGGSDARWRGTRPVVAASALACARRRLVAARIAAAARSASEKLPGSPDDPTTLTSDDANVRLATCRLTSCGRPEDTATAAFGAPGHRGNPVFADTV